MYPTLIQGDDYQLRKRILNFVQFRGVNGLDEVELEVSGGIVTIHGQLPSEHDEQLFLECCRHVPGVLRIEGLSAVPELCAS